MKTVSVTSLKNHWSEYLRWVKKGVEVVVTSHHRLLVKLVPYTEGHALQIISARRSAHALRKIKGVSLSCSVNWVDLLREDRDRR